MNEDTPNKDNVTCTIPYDFNGVENYFCALNFSSFICKRNATNDFGECKIGKSNDSFSK